MGASALGSVNAEAFLSGGQGCEINNGENKMRINLIGMILNNTGRRCFEGAIIDDDGKKLDAVHSLDFMIMEYAKVKNGGHSSTVAVSKDMMPSDKLK